MSILFSISAARADDSGMTKFAHVVAENTPTGLTALRFRGLANDRCDSRAIAMVLDASDFRNQVRLVFRQAIQLAHGLKGHIIMSVTEASGRQGDASIAEV